MTPKTKLLNQMRAVLRLKHMSFRTEVSSLPGACLSKLCAFERARHLTMREVEEGSGNFSKACNRILVYDACHITYPASATLVAEPNA